jgi:hypothetical protein
VLWTVLGARAARGATPTWTAAGPAAPAQVTAALTALDDYRILLVEAFVVGDHIVLLAPTSDVLPWVRHVLGTFDLRAKTWTVAGPSPYEKRPICVPPMPAVSGRQLLVGLGETAKACLRRVWAFDPARGTWENLTPPGEALAQAADSEAYSIAAADEHHAYFLQPLSLGASRGPDAMMWGLDLDARAWHNPPPLALFTDVDMVVAGGELTVLDTGNVYGGPAKYHLRLQTLGNGGWRATDIPARGVYQAGALWADADEIVYCCGRRRSTTWNLYRHLSPHESPYDYKPSDAGMALDRKSGTWKPIDEHHAAPHESHTVFLRGAHRAVLVFAQGPIEVLDPSARSWRAIGPPAEIGDVEAFPDARRKAAYVLVGDVLYRLDLASGALTRLALE